MIKTIGLIGAGSVGGGLLSEMYKADAKNVYVIALGERAERMQQKGITINNETIFPQIYSDTKKGTHLDLLIVAVKTYSLEKAIEDFAPLIDESTIILPIQNGIMATPKLRERFPNNRVLYGVVLRTDAHRMGGKIFFNTLGEMQIGYANNTVVEPEILEVHDRLKELGINVKIYDDMRKAQWRKWMLNTGASQAAAEVQVECGFFNQVEEIETLMRLCMDEILALAKVEKVNITEKDRDEIIEILLNFPPDKKMSMLQDLEAGRPIEIEEYAGRVIQMGKEYGIPTPINEVLYLTIKARQKLVAMRRHF